jgi:hypothetical protein
MINSKVLAVGAALAGMAAMPQAEARGFVRFAFGGPVGPAYVVPPPPAYYYPPPAYYYYPYPPPVAYAPPGAYPPPPAAAGAVAPQQTCREYQGSVTVGGQTQPSYGTACLQPDGSWRIVR